MSIRRLRTDVYVGGVRHLAGTAETDELSKSITNPKAWEESEPEEVISDDSSIPPKSGKGSNVDAWRAYAAALGFEADEDATKAEIIATLEAEGIPTSEE